VLRHVRRLVQGTLAKRHRELFMGVGGWVGISGVVGALGRRSAAAIFS
jgi:hypothetical protein